MKKSYNKGKIRYYTGWGVAFGSIIGACFGIMFRDYLIIFFFLGIIIGGLIGTIYGKRKVR